MQIKNNHFSEGSCWFACRASTLTAHAARLQFPPVAEAQQRAAPAGLCAGLEESVVLWSAMMHTPQCGRASARHLQTVVTRAPVAKGTSTSARDPPRYDKSGGRPTSASAM